MTNVVGVGIRNCSYQNVTREKIKVVAYCRVSTSSDEQMLAIDAQIEWVKDYIARHPNWELVDLYVDRGISGTQVDTRPEFQRLLFDLRNGRAQLCVCRELSRFSRDIISAISLTRGTWRDGGRMSVRQRWHMVFVRRGRT